MPKRGKKYIDATRHFDRARIHSPAEAVELVKTLSKRNWQPDQDFASNATASAAAINAGTLVAVQLAPLASQSQETDKPTGITLLVDTSASRALGYAGYIKSVHELATKLRAQYGDALRLR